MGQKMADKTRKLAKTAPNYLKFNEIILEKDSIKMSANHSARYENYEKNIGKNGSFEDVEELFDTFWSWRMKEWPEFATFVGCTEFDHLLNDNSLEGFKRRNDKGLEFLAHCDKLLEKGGLDEKVTLNVKLLREDLRVFTEGYKFQAYLFPVCYAEGIQIDFEQLTSWIQFKTSKDYENYIARLRAIPERITTDIELMKEGVKQEKVLHLHSMKGVFEQCDKLVNVTHPTHTTLWQPFLSFPDGIDEEARNGFTEAALEIIEKSIMPAFTKLRVFIENVYLPSCRAKEGISTLPGGADFYQQCLKFHLSLNLTAEQVHNVGRREVQRIRQAMEEVVKKIGYQGEFREFLHHLRTNQDFYYESKEELLEDVKDICYNKIRPKLSDLFHKIPESKLIIEAVPESRPDAPLAYYLSGTLDGSRPGKYFVNANRLDMCPKYDLMTLSLHEGEPGHHFQGMYSIEMKGEPIFRQYMEDMYYGQAPGRFPIHTAYCEGWGLYCEYLGNEMGLYEDDLYSLFGHLSFEMHRACRLVADTGIHHYGWSYEKARLLFLENTSLSEPNVNNEVKRYITLPGQACAYKIGQMKIKQLRQKASDALGEKFCVKDFHDVCLKCLGCPVNVLEMLVDRYIKSQKET